MLEVETNNDFVFSISTRCENDSHTQIPINCVRSIRNHYPNSDIFIVDSNSPVKTHINDLKEMGCIISELENLNYESGAMWETYNKIKKDKYIFLQDSILLLGNIDEFIKKDVAIFGNLISNWEGCGQEHIEWIHQNILNSDYRLENLSNGFNLVQYNSFIVSRNILNKFKDKNLDKILPLNKIGSCGMERILGIALSLEGYPINEEIQVHRNLIQKTLTYRQ
jgi:hypothetical protein